MPAEQRGEMRSYAELKIPFSTQRGTDWNALANVRKTPLMSDYQLQGRQPSLIMTTQFYPKENIYRICLNVPIMDLYNWSQLELLSPSQCPDHFPLEG